MSSNTRATANRFGKLMALSLVAGLAGIFTLTLAIEAVAANSSSTGSGHAVDFLIKVDSGKSASAMKTLKGLTAQVGGQAETLNGRLHDDSHWVSIKAPTKSIRLSMKALQAIPGVRLVQPNYPIRLLNDYRIQDARQRDALANTLRKVGMKTADGRTSVFSSPMPMDRVGRALAARRIAAHGDDAHVERLGKLRQPLLPDKALRFGRRGKNGTGDHGNRILRRTTKNE